MSLWEEREKLGERIAVIARWANIFCLRVVHLFNPFRPSSLLACLAKSPRHKGGLLILISTRLFSNTCKKRNIKTTRGPQTKGVHNERRRKPRKRRTGIPQNGTMELPSPLGTKTTSKDVVQTDWDDQQRERDRETDCGREDTSDRSLKQLRTRIGGMSRRRSRCLRRES